MGGVKGTRYLLTIDFCNIRAQKKLKNAEKVIKNYFRILKKTHAHLQTILKTPVKFQKDRTKTAGGVKGTKYLLKTRNHAPRPKNRKFLSGFNDEDDDDEFRFNDVSTLSRFNRAFPGQG